jgi:tRNA A58 N-methylase Trm61
MKVVLDIEKPTSVRGAFTTLEDVRGVAKLYLPCADAVSRIVVSLRGKCSSCTLPIRL